MNRAYLIGNLTADPQSKTVGEHTVCNFTIAVSSRRKDQNGQYLADFFRIDAWDKLGESCQKYLTKGRKVCVIGPVSCRAYTAQDGSARASMEVRANDVEFLSSGTEQQTQAPAESIMPNMTPVNVDGELPF